MADYRETVVDEVANSLVAYVAERPQLEADAHEAWRVFEQKTEAYRIARGKHLLGEYSEPFNMEGKRLTADQRDAWVFAQTSPEREELSQAESQHRVCMAAVRINDETQKSYRAILRAFAPQSE